MIVVDRSLFVVIQKRKPLALLPRCDGMNAGKHSKMRLDTVVVVEATLKFRLARLNLLQSSCYWLF